MHLWLHVEHLDEVHPRELDRHRVEQRFYRLVLQRAAQSRVLGELAYLRKLDDLRRHGQCVAQTNVARCVRWRKDFRCVRHAVGHRVERSYDRQTIFHHVVRMIFHRVGQTVCHHEEQKIFRHDLQTAYHHVEQKACHREARRACHHVGQSYARHGRQTACRRVGHRGVTRVQRNHHRLGPNCDRY